jgi:hypothetical protein
MPGIGDEMEGAIQQAAQLIRHFIGVTIFPVDTLFQIH